MNDLIERLREHYKNLFDCEENLYKQEIAEDCKEAADALGKKDREIAGWKDRVECNNRQRMETKAQRDRAEKAEDQLAQLRKQRTDYRRDNEQLRKENERLKTMSVVEMMCENLNVKHHVEEWETRCLKAEQQIERLTKERDELKINLEASENNGLKWLRERDRMLIERDRAAGKNITLERDNGRLRGLLERVTQAGYVLRFHLQDDGQYADDIKKWDEAQKGGE